MLSRQSTTKTGPGSTFPGHQTPGHQVPGGFASPYLPPPVTLVFVDSMIHVTLDTLHHNNCKATVLKRSEIKTSPQTCRRDTNHLLSQLRKAPQATTPLQLMLLQDEMAKAMYVEETALLSSGRLRKKLFLSCGGNELENSETQVSHRGTSRTKHRDMATDLVKSSLPALRSFRRTTSQVEDSTSVKEEETGMVSPPGSG